jgi:hypothetical protein
MKINHNDEKKKIYLDEEDEFFLTKFKENQKLKY